MSHRNSSVISEIVSDDRCNWLSVIENLILYLFYFRIGIRYVSGGVSSGFQHVTTNDSGQKRMFQVKGKRNVRVREVGISISNMNKGDCFILEDGRNIYVYVGPSAKRVEKLKAISAANQIRDQDHNGRAQIHILGEYHGEMI